VAEAVQRELGDVAADTLVASLVEPEQAAEPEPEATRDPNATLN
jgi:hypothetical protein